MEVEAKVALDADRLAAVRVRLTGLAAKPSPPVEEADTFFSHPSRDLAAADEALRLRRTAASFELTHKGPRRAGPVKSRAERTVRMADDPTEVLAALGFAPSARLRKRRERFRLPAVEVTLDHVEGLGWFAEVEALAAGGTSGTGGEAAVEAVQQALRQLGLEDAPREPRSYVELALAAGAAAAERV
jgi:adenylate cyclase class 2